MTKQASHNFQPLLARLFVKTIHLCRQFDNIDSRWRRHISILIIVVAISHSVLVGKKIYLCLSAEYRGDISSYGIVRRQNVIYWRSVLLLLHRAEDGALWYITIILSTRLFHLVSLDKIDCVRSVRYQVQQFLKDQSVCNGQQI